MGLPQRSPLSTAWQSWIVKFLPSVKRGERHKHGGERALRAILSRVPFHALPSFAAKGTYVSKSRPNAFASASTSAQQSINDSHSASAVDHSICFFSRKSSLRLTSSTLTPRSAAA